MEAHIIWADSMDMYTMLIRIDDTVSIGAIWRKQPT